MPIAFLRTAAVVWIIGAAELLLCWLALQAVAVDSVARPVRPWEEARWLALPAAEKSLGELRAVEGQSVEQAVARLGPPLHVNRSHHLPIECAQTYLYAARAAGRRGGARLCISESGAVAGILDATEDSGGLQFDLRDMTDAGLLSANTLLLYFWAALPAMPLALAIVLIRRARRRPLGLTP